MYISPTWAIALTTAAVLAVVIEEALRREAGLPWIGRVAYLLGGTLAGFLAIAFPPAWPLLAFLGTLLIGMALRDRRPADVALLVTGFGATWTLMLGFAVLNDLADPAVYGSPGDIAWFVVGATVLIAGLGALLALALRDPG